MNLLYSLLERNSKEGNEVEKGESNFVEINPWPSMLAMLYR
jgi:hypothetical protein